MKTETLNYNLPSELIAQHPCDVRSDSRLLVLNRCDGGVADSCFRQIADFLSAGDCLVLNDTKVLPARFYAQKTTGGKIEGLFLKESAPGVWLVMLKGARKIKVGQAIGLQTPNPEEPLTAIVTEKAEQGRCELKIQSEQSCAAILNRIGFPPLPPYIKRGADYAQARIDKARYQTVYARHRGAVAAPTAGLHFTDEIIELLKAKGVRFARVTLHVGAGTFKPVTAETIEEHDIHEERFSIDAENAAIINAAKERGGKIVAVGTTAVRTLETVAEAGKVTAASGATRLFITPGYEFEMIDAMITNFHLPRSTLLALVTAFAGLENTLAAYRHAIDQKYRFYSYGDAMLII